MAAVGRWHDRRHVDADARTITDLEQGQVAATAELEYAQRLERLQGKRWKKVLNVQLPWKLHVWPG